MAANAELARLLSSSIAHTQNDFAAGARCEISPEGSCATYIPSDRERLWRQKALDALSRIEKGLPKPSSKIKIALLGTNDEYPRLEGSVADGTWFSTLADGRAIFCIEGGLYFRRYNDDWNPLVLRASVSANKTTPSLIQWAPGGIGDAALVKIADECEHHGGIDPE